MRGRSKSKVYWQIEKKKGNTSYSFQFLKEPKSSMQFSPLLSTLLLLSNGFLEQSVLFGFFSSRKMASHWEQKRRLPCWARGLENPTCCIITFMPTKNYSGIYNSHEILPCGKFRVGTIWKKNPYMDQFVLSLTNLWIDAYSADTEAWLKIHIQEIAHLTMTWIIFSIGETTIKIMRIKRKYAQSKQMIRFLLFCTSKIQIFGQIFCICKYKNKFFRKCLSVKILWW